MGMVWMVAREMVGGAKGLPPEDAEDAEGLDSIGGAGAEDVFKIGSRC
jgi:hypothetical protein